MKKVLITFIFSTLTFIAYTQTAKQVVENFITSIGKQDFKTAYALQNIPAWGSLEKFSSVKAFGGIYKTEIISIEQKPDDKGNSVVFADVVYYDSINGSKEFEENFYLNHSTGKLKIAKVKVLKTKNPMLKKITDKDFKAYVAIYKETYFPVDLAKSVSTDGAPEIPEQYIKKYIDKDYITSTGEVPGVAKYCYSSALFTNQYIAVLYIYACEMCKGTNSEYQTLYLNTFTYGGIPISKFEIGSNSSAVGSLNNGGTIRNSYQMSGKINSNSISKVFFTHYEEEILKGTAKGNTFQIQPNGQVIENPEIKMTNFPIDFIKKASIDRKLHYQFSIIELGKLKNIDKDFFTKWLSEISASTSIGVENLEWKEFETYQFFDFKELDNKFLFSIITTDQSSFNYLIHFTLDKGKGKIVQVFKSGIIENDDPGHHTSLNYNKAGDILKLEVISKEKDTISIEKFEFNLQATKYTKIDASSKLGGTFKDSRDGHVYKTIKIGNQTWLAENLAFKASSGSWAYNNDEKNATKYGRLYNWETAKNVCPTGYHLPTKDEYGTLLGYYGGSGSNGFEANYTALISSGNSGFSVLLGGERYGDGSFMSIDNRGGFWSVSWDDGINARKLYITSIGKKAYISYDDMSFGLSVRCIQDN